MGGARLEDSEVLFKAGRRCFLLELMEKLSPVAMENFKQKKKRQAPMSLSPRKNSAFCDPRSVPKYFLDLAVGGKSIKRSRHTQRRHRFLGAQEYPFVLKRHLTYLQSSFRRAAFHLTWSMETSILVLRNGAAVLTLCSSRLRLNARGRRQSKANLPMYVEVGQNCFTEIPIW